MTFALEVEREGYQSLLNLHEVADKHGDFDVSMCVNITTQGPLWAELSWRCKKKWDM